MERYGLKIGRNGVIRRCKNGRWEEAKRYDRNGYDMVSVYIDGKQKFLYVHRLVAEAYLDNPGDLPCVNHKDGNKRNNNASNLEWCSYSENALHAYAMGLRKALSERRCAYCGERMGYNVKQPYHMLCKEHAAYERKQMRAANLQRILDKSVIPESKKERNKIIAGFVLMGCTLQSVGDKFGITKERVRQIVNDIRGKRTDFCQRYDYDRRALQAAQL